MGATRPDIVIRAAVAGDASLVADIYNHYVAKSIITVEEDEVSDGEMARRIEEVQLSTLPWLVAEREGRIAGYAYATKWRARPAYRLSAEVTVYVDPSCGRLGTGSALYEELIFKLQASGIHAAIGGIALPNEASLALHEKLGFFKVAHFKEVGFKFNRWVDVGYWQRNLCPLSCSLSHTHEYHGGVEMADLEKAAATQLSNIEKRTGKSLAELATLIQESGLSKHGELVSMLKSTLGMGHGDANALVHFVRKEGASSPASAQERSGPQVLDELYSGPKAALRPIHERLQEELERIGPCDRVPKKSYISYRRKKQFATIGPATKTQVEVGLNMMGVAPTERLQALPAGKMCNYTVRLSEVEEVDAELLGWLRRAHEASD